MLIDTRAAADDEPRRMASGVPALDSGGEDAEEDAADGPWTTDPDEWPPHFGAARLGIP